MKTVTNPLVCFFDSGIGGLTLLAQCVKKLPRVNFTYFADNYRMPYGNLTREQILSYVDEIFQKIQKLEPAAAVVACNTVTAQCIEWLRNKYAFKIIGIQPAVKPAVSANKRCLVLATPATVESSALKELIKKTGGNVTVKACPELAEYVEKEIFVCSVKDVTNLLPSVKTDSVVLGCTHYSFIKDVIKEFYNCPVFDGNEGTANHLCEILGICDHLTPRAQKITFSGGDVTKNRAVFNTLLKQNGNLSQ